MGVDRESDPALERAAAARVARLATVDASSRPHLVPICFVLLERGADRSLYSVIDDKPKPTRTGLRRLRNIAANPSVTVLVDHYDEDWSRLWFVQLAGEAGMVEDAAEYETALVALRAKYSQYRSMSLAAATHPMLVVRIARVHSWSASTAGAAVP